MSLRAFHIFFILVSIAFLAGFGFREAGIFQRTAVQASLWMSIGSFALAAALSVYLRWFIAKRKRTA